MFARERDSLIHARRDVRGVRYTHLMSFGRNPYVTKAEAAELKAQAAGDPASSARAWREAGQLWERAADRETNDKRRAVYAENATRARATADDPPPADDAPAEDPPAADEASAGNPLN